jgi:hypothetical protein
MSTSLFKMRPTKYLQENSIDSAHKPQSAILPERFAIVFCGLLVAVVAIPLLVVIQVLSALFWGTTTVFRLLKGEGLFDEEDGI